MWRALGWKGSVQVDRPQIRADSFHVDDLVARAMQGRIRVPRFQRGLKWRDTDVQKLFDSIHRGFPIGTLLMWKRQAPNEPVSFGPVEVPASATDDAWWVVDGQQRLTSLVAGLNHPDPHDPDDPFVVYYDLKAEDGQPEFFRPHRLRRRTPYCIPIARCHNPADFQSWLFDFVEETGERSLIERASDVATRIRNYRVPVYVVETDDVDVARQIFLRTNRAGRRMDLHEVFAALAPPNLDTASRPEAIAERLSAAFGPLEANVVAKAAKALVSDDVTHIESHPEVADARKWMADAESALGRALRFIRECGVPHTRLLPFVPTPVVTLARFFARHPQPSARNLRLLRRWLWRGFFSDGLASDAKTFRRAVVAVGSDEDESVQALLAQVSKQPSYQLPAEFDARNGAARLAVLALSTRNPWPPYSGPSQLVLGEEVEVPGEVFDWLQLHGSDAFSHLRGLQDNLPAARFLTPGVSPARLRDSLVAWAQEDLEHPALHSHLVPPEAAQALLDGDMERLVEVRTRALLDVLDALHAAMAEPEHADRAPLSVALA
ncbi:MAG: DUF262 domain-containing protein [Myxococcota bacterium]